MSHYEERLEQDLKEIRVELDELVKSVDHAITQATTAMLEGDEELASWTIVRDHTINRLARSIDNLCHSFIVRHLPSAGHLRFISSMLRLTISFERIGDYAASIAREALVLSKHLPKSVAKDIQLMSDQSRANVSQATRAFLDGDPELARETKQSAFDSRRTFGSLYKDLVKVGNKHSRPPEDLFAFLITFYRLERMTDHARNICEEALFSSDGEIKSPKTQRILFVDEHCTVLAPLAAALGAKAYPDSGVFGAAGFSPSESVLPSVLEYMSEHGLDGESFAPMGVPTDHDDLIDYDLIVCLEGKARERIENLPFRTVLLHVTLEDYDPQRPLDAETIEDIHEELSVKLHDLMDLLAGDEAH